MIFSINYEKTVVTFCMYVSEQSYILQGSGSFGDTSIFFFKSNSSSPHSCHFRFSHTFIVILSLSIHGALRCCMLFTVSSNSLFPDEHLSSHLLSPASSLTERNNFNNKCHNNFLVMITITIKITSINAPTERVTSKQPPTSLYA